MVAALARHTLPEHLHTMADPLIIARVGTTDLALLPALSNRHGCITGATGTGKTISLQVMAERFSRIGVPVFLADVKGDLSGISKPGTATGKLTARLEKLGLPTPAWSGCPVTFWDVFGEQGHPVRATISDMGPLLLSRLLNLNDTQEGVLAMAFRVADDNGLLLLNLADLRAMLQFLGENAAEVRTQYGNVSAASIGAIQRGLLQIEEQGGTKFFGEPMLNIQDLMQTVDGRGVVNILVADRLMNNPRLYASFLLWMLAELFENLPEVGDREKPKLVFFFDEAHLLFADAPAALLEKVELVVRLIRSKGVGVFFVTQNPIDIPDKVLGQLGKVVGRARRAYLRFMAEGRDLGHQVNYYQIVDQRFLGDERFVEQIEQRSPAEREIEVPGPTASFSDLVRLLGEEYGVDARELLRAGRKRQWVRARSMLVYLAREWGTMSVKELGRRLHRDPSIISRLYAAYAASRDVKAESRLAKQLRQ